MLLNNRFRPFGALLAGVIAGFAINVAHAGGFAVVTNNNDAGSGSLREALEVQQANVVVIPRRIGDINITDTLEYSATSPLVIFGTGQTVSTLNNVTLLAITQGADVNVSNLNFAGPGGFSILNRGDQGSTPAGKGIFVDVRDDQTGTVNVVLNKVSVSGVANHGIHISDCSLADECGGGSSGGGEGSPASIALICNQCRVENAGNGKFDADGIRIDDRGDGDISAFFKDSSFTHVGADGVELDEGNDGSIFLKTVRTDFSDNGGYCDPEILGPFVPTPDEAEFDESEMVTLADIPGPVTGSPDDSCIEYAVDEYDSGFIEAYEFAIDLDDGIDLDEAGEGSLWTSMINSTINGNLDEGVDFDEADDGDIIASFVRTRATDNNDDGFKMSEEDGGNVYSDVRGSRAANNGGKGFVFEEADDGDLTVSVRGSSTANNDDSDDTGIEAVQEDEGTGTLRVRGSNIADGIDLDGVEQI